MRIETDPATRAKWRPISEFHEELQPVVVIDIDDPGGVMLAWHDDIVRDLEENPGAWTHFAELPLLTNEMAEEIKRAAEIARGQ